MAPRTINRPGPSSSVSSSQGSTSEVSSQVSDMPSDVQEIIQRVRNRAQRQRPRESPSMHPQFRSKPVCELICRHCDTLVCHRGMQAILLGDVRVHLFSTDVPIAGRVQLVNEDYTTRNCRCRITDVACLTCGNIIGYSVTQPCDSCLSSCNNGHLSMFVQEGVYFRDRLDPNSPGKLLLWGDIPDIDTDNAAYGVHRQPHTKESGLKLGEFWKTTPPPCYSLGLRYDGMVR